MRFLSIFTLLCFDLGQDLSENPNLVVGFTISVSYISVYIYLYIYEEYDSVYVGA